MTLLLDIAVQARPISPRTTGREVYQRFQEEPDTLAIAVVDQDGRPVGLIERHDFLVRMAAQYGHALWSGRPVSEWLSRDPVLADGDMTVAEFCGRILEERPSELLQGFIVTCGGRYAGVGTALSLLQETASATANHARAMAELAEAAEASSRAAHDALAAKGRFLAVMSHEIRTPLNGVLAVAEIVRRKLQQPDLAPFVDTILESGGVLLRLLNDALDLSRAEASGLELDEEPLCAADLLDEVVSLWSPQAELRGLTLLADYQGPADVWALGDRVRLRQVFNNLVSNALKFSTGSPVQVRLKVSRRKGCLVLRGEVADRGPGVPADRRESIFEPFRQTDEGVRLGGAGLGLAVCRQIVERMQGWIRAEANPGGGALFRFETPLHEVPAPVRDEAVPESPAGAGASLHVLIADDNATNRMVARTLCELFGCTCETVEDGAAAVEAAATGRFDLILMDIKMPGMDGVEATRRIRSGPDAWCQAPILALTANADPADAALYRSAGINGVVEKPIKPERLLSAMSAVLEIEAAATEAAA
ncbi:ATP-binding protein [Phenylobacterium deserti]|uniref:histidine kinase n=1 Tax=Phenylobacterium deserti TaxID=1914756 RepID=A0A328ARE4_9CAUL|nr:ATP-binding protein [Phenylobacterium deserti]RAK57612.1 response regulator receiver protein [Phenylobacterium deserti]